MSNLKFTEKSILIDIERKNKIIRSYQPEEYQKFKKNRNKVDPIYLEKDIEYRFNNQGYRTKNIENLEKNFALVFGCSHTEGVGNFEEDIWCSQLLRAKSIDFFNLGKASTGPDIQYLNTLQWIKNEYPLPKIVIYQWPQTFRKSFAYEDSKFITLMHHNVNNKQERRDTNWYLKRYCVDEGEMQINNHTAFHSANLYWKLLGVPVLNWSFQGEFEKDYNDLHIIKTVDTGRARDLMHDGPGNHKQVAEQLSPLIDELI